MEIVSIFFAIATLLVITLSTITVWSRKEKMRWVAVVLALFAIVFLYQGAVTMLSRAKPVEMSFFEEQVTVNGFYVQDKVALYLMTRTMSGLPRLYRVEWYDGMEKKVDELMEAARVSSETGQRVVVSKSDDDEFDDSVNFSTFTPPENPPK
tara:strand:- start:625 stop:1080 length:456 start_codon:yes stop_codon:yes gene_type:complete